MVCLCARWQTAPGIAVVHWGTIRQIKASSDWSPHRRGNAMESADLLADRSNTPWRPTAGSLHRKRDTRLMNVNQFAAEIGVTTRTVRSYHARGLLPQPVRVGRTPYYLRAHLTRMRHVLRLQRQGLSLDAVQALLEPDACLVRLLPVGRAVTEALRERPDLLAAMVANGILVRRADGTVEVRAARAVLTARTAGVSAVAALALLAEVAETLAPQADDVLEAVRRMASWTRTGPTPCFDDLVTLAVEVVRARIAQAVRREEAPGRPA
ncbi:MerR family transcriptional regulator [Saccharothrix syringae]|nr:MerR family transcriptional regulator [Saccharothrix syringae]